MKKAFVVLLLIGIGCLVVACARNRQTHLMKKSATAQHLTFVNSEINGSCADFAQMLMNKGFTFEGIEDNQYLLRGNYMRNRNCEIRLSPVVNPAVKDSNQIYMVTVAMNKGNCEDSEDVYRRYLEIKDVLTEEFGEPNGTEHYKGVTPLPCNSTIEFESPEGFIKLGLNQKRGIELYYIDKINAELNQTLSRDFDNTHSISQHELGYETENAS